MQADLLPNKMVLFRISSEINQRNPETGILDTLMNYLVSNICWEIEPE